MEAGRELRYMRQGSIAARLMLLLLGDPRYRTSETGTAGSASVGGFGADQSNRWDCSCI